MRWMILVLSGAVGIGVVGLALGADVAAPVNGPKPATKPAAAQPAPAITPAQQAKIDAAVADLSADDWKKRQAAQDALARLGAPAIPTLKRLSAKGDDEEVRTRAAAALRQIEDGARVGGTRVTMSLKNATPKDAFAELGKLARYEFPTQPPNLWQQAANGTVTAEYDDVDFWTAFKDLCQKAGVYPQPYGGGARMTLQQGSNPQWAGPSTVSGPFLIVANRIQRTNSVEFTTPDNVQRECNLTLTAMSEPKVRVVQSSYAVDVKEAVDENGNSLVADAQSSYGMNSGQQWMWNLQARLAYPEKNAGQRVARFRGAVKFLVQLESETFEVTDVLTAKAVEKRIANRRIQFKQAKKQNENQYEVQVVLYRDGMPQAEWGAMSSSAQGVKLLDKDGRALSSNGWGTSSDGQKLEFNWSFGRQQHFGAGEGKPGEPYRLTWEIPTETREMEVPFEFKDLRLP